MLQTYYVTETGRILEFCLEKFNRIFYKVISRIEFLNGHVLLKCNVFFTLVSY